MIKFSVVIPVYNVERYLDQCVKSVLSQSFENYEIILVDDGSTDSSGKMCDEYGNKDNGIKVVHKRNGGLSSARNAGLHAASGDYVLFLDSDDYWTDGEMLSKLNSEIEITDADVIVYNFFKLHEKNGVIEKKDFCAINLTGDKARDVRTLLTDTLYSSSACFKCIKLSLIHDNGIYFEEGKFSEDVEWSARILILAKRFACVNEGFYVYRQRARSISHTISDKNIDDLQNAIIKAMDYVDKYSIEEPFLSAYNAYVAYQFATLCFCVNLLPSKDLRKKRVKMIKPYKKVLNYGLAKKVKLLDTVRKFVGLGGAIKLAYVIRNKND